MVKYLNEIYEMSCSHLVIFKKYLMPWENSDLSEKVRLIYNYLQSRSLNFFKHMGQGNGVLVL